MQKRGFPAAAILALIVLLIVMLIIVGQWIHHRLEIRTRDKSKTSRRSITTITTYRSRQASPSTAISYPSTPLLHPMHLRKDLPTTNTMVELLSIKSHEYVVDVHRRDGEDELSVFLFEQTDPTHIDTKDIADIDEDVEV
jgi:hypothetical protein